jgi:hypothetical protein
MPLEAASEIGPFDSAPNPEEFNEMNAYEQVLELSYLNLQGVGDQHDSDMLLWNIEIDVENVNPDANPYEYDFENDES